MGEYVFGISIIFASIDLEMQTISISIPSPSIMNHWKIVFSFYIWPNPVANSGEIFSGVFSYYFMSLFILHILHYAA